MSRIVDISNKNLADASHLFNCSIFKVEDQLYLAYRANQSYLDAKIYINKLNNTTYQPMGKPKPLNIPNTTTTAAAGWEDPRMFWYAGELYCAFVFIRAGFTAQAQGLAKLDKNFNVTRVWFLNYKRNLNSSTIDTTRIMDPRGFITTAGAGSHFEKNWQFFQHGEELLFVYGSSPHTVAAADLLQSKVKQEYVSKVALPWSLGEIRGGTPPVDLGDKYITFFHSSAKRDSDYRIYHIGAYTFEKTPPFNPIEISEVPLLSGDETDDYRGMWKNVVVFPCGALKLDEKWLVSYGHNDYCSKLLSITHEEVLANLTKINHAKPKQRRNKRRKGIQPCSGTGDSQEKQEGRSPLA